MYQSIRRTAPGDRQDGEVATKPRTPEVVVLVSYSIHQTGCTEIQQHQANNQYRETLLLTELIATLPLAVGTRPCRYARNFRGFRIRALSARAATTSMPFCSPNSSTVKENIAHVLNPTSRELSRSAGQGRSDTFK